MSFNPFSKPDPLLVLANKIVADFKETGKFNNNKYPDIIHPYPYNKDLTCLDIL